MKVAGGGGGITFLRFSPSGLGIKLILATTASLAWQPKPIFHSKTVEFRWKPIGIGEGCRGGGPHFPSLFASITGPSKYCPKQGLATEPWLENTYCSLSAFLQAKPRHLTLMEKLVSPRLGKNREGAPEKGNSTRRLDFQSSVHPRQLCIHQLWKSGAGERGRLTIFSIYRQRLKFTHKLTVDISFKETLWGLLG